jgi:hypothetical protein
LRLGREAHRLVLSLLDEVVDLPVNADSSVTGAVLSTMRSPACDVNFAYVKLEGST